MENEFGDVNEDGLEVDEVRNNSSLHLGVGAGAKQEVERWLEEADLPRAWEERKRNTKKGFRLSLWLLQRFCREAARHFCSWLREEERVKASNERVLGQFPQSQGGISALQPLTLFGQDQGSVEANAPCFGTGHLSCSSAIPIWCVFLCLTPAFSDLMTLSS